MGRADVYLQPDAADPVLPAELVLGLARAHLPDRVRLGGLRAVDESGGEARVYLLDGDVVVKTQRPHRLRPRTSLAKEAALLTALAEPLGGRIPVLFGYDQVVDPEAGAVEFLVMGRVGGRAVRHVEIPAATRAALLGEIGRVLRTVHALDIAAAGCAELVPTDGDAARLRRRLELGLADVVEELSAHPAGWTLPLSPAEVAARAVAVLPAELTAGPVVLHSNPGPTHVFTDPGGRFTRLIDFGDAYRSHPALDLRAWPDPADRLLLREAYLDGARRRRVQHGLDRRDDLRGPDRGGPASRARRPRGRRSGRASGRAVTAGSGRLERPGAGDLLPAGPPGAQIAEHRRAEVGFWRGMRPYVRQVGGLLAVGSLCGIAMNTAVVLPAVLLGQAVDAVLAVRRGQAGAGAVTAVALLLVAGTLATEVPRIGKRYWLGVCKSRIRANVRADALRGVLAWPADRLHTTSVGEVMARIIGDVEVLGVGVGEVMVETWDTLLFSVSLVVVMLSYDPTLGVLALAPVPAALVLAKLVGRCVARRTLAAREANAVVTAFVQEGLTGLRVLRVSGRGTAYAARLRGLADAQADAELAAIRLSAQLAPVYTLLTTGGVVAVVWLGGLRVTAGALSVGDLVAFLALFARFTGRAFRIPQMANRVQAAAAAYTRLAPLLAPVPPPAGEPPRARWRTDRVTGLPSVPRTGPIPRAAAPLPVAVDRVRFTYPGAGAPALDGVSLTVPAGSLVAVTGPVGSGKSALARLVVGLYPPDAGRVRVDGADPHRWDARQRAQVGYLPQGHPVFSGTIAENVLLTDPRAAWDPTVAGPAARLGEALALAGLAPDVAGLPDGVATGIGELGVRVSGGQRQRIALARALAGPAAGAPRLVVLDDPFSAVDVDTEAAIITALRAAVGPTAPPERRATVLLCSTRLAAFPQADQIVVLDRGRIAEQGSHAELLAAGGLYARIFTAQRQHRSAAAHP